MPCVFCRSTEPLTNEHAIPGWIGKHLGQGSVTHNYIPWKASEPAWTYKKKELSIEAKAVCESCNTGWMSDLEDDVAPILGPLIDGEERLLGATNRELLAAWATKTVLMIQQAMPTAARVSTGADYQNFYARRRPPRDARLWLAASGERHAGSTGPLSLTLDRPPHRRESFWAAFLYLGHAVFLIAGPGLSSTPALHPDYSGWTVPLWPGLEPVSWPPATRLTRDQMGVLPQVFGSLLYLPAHGPPAERIELAL